MKTLLLALLVASSAFAQPARMGKITGQVEDASTLEPLTGVNIWIDALKMGTASDLDGRFVIENVPVGLYVVQISYLGYEARRITDVTVGSNRTTSLPVKLNPQTLESEEVTVTGDVFTQIGVSGINTAAFNTEELRRNPGAAQEIARVIMALPGVVARGETSQDIMVRGGSPLENGFIIDNMIVPGVQHFLMQSGQSSGPIGLINTDLLQDLSFYSGGFSPAFGDKMSSFSQITYREGIRNGTKGQAGFNMAGVTGYMEGKLGNGSYLVSARRSYLDLIAGLINAGGAPRYNDAQLKTVHEISKKDKITTLLVVGSSIFEQSVKQAEEIGLIDLARSASGQLTVGTNWRHLWKSGYSQTSVSFSGRNEDTKVRDRITDVEEIRFDIQNTYIAARNFSYFDFDRLGAVEFGFDLQQENGDYDYFLAESRSITGDLIPEYARNMSLSGTTGGVFGNYRFTPVRNWKMNVGLRTDYRTYNGDVTFSPRFSTTYEITPKLEISASAGRFYQTLPRFLMSQETSFKQLKTPYSDHLIGGFAYLLSNDTRFTVEIFNKNYSDLPMWSSTSNRNNPSFVFDEAGQLFDKLDNSGTSYARGIEFLLQKKLAKNLFGTASFTYFTTEYRDQNGVWRRRNFDNKFTFSVVGGYKPNKYWLFSARWTYLGGRPYTPYDETLTAQYNTEVWDLSRFNDAVAPAFHSLYLRFDRRYFQKNVTLVTYMELWNAYNRKNIDGYYWNRTEQRIDGIPQFSFIPVGGVAIEF